MKKKSLFLAMLCMVLAFGFVIVGCGDDNEDGGSGKNEAEAMGDVTDATTAAAMKTALEEGASALGINLTIYNTLTTSQKTAVANVVLAGKPYADAAAIKAVFDTEVTMLSGGGNTDPKVFTITGIDNTLYGYAVASQTFAYVSIYPSGSTISDLYTQTGLVAHAEIDTRNSDPNHVTIDAVSGNHTLTANLYAAPALTAVWNGSGTYDVYLGIGLGLSSHGYRCVNVTISSATTTKAVTAFTEVP
ncbi:MAG: hypothetical protein Ta2B_14730 [Termitinemataceae bacterium]|nr:MAG: hypothetical protein Ta2B_14730 [Termitinemataceae bacterium]